MIPSTALYSFDFVLCMDYTEKISPLGNDLKNLPEKISLRLAELTGSLYKAIKQVRVALVVGGYATPFFSITEDKKQLKAELEKIVPTADPNPVTSLFRAMQADWIQVPKGEKRKHAIIMLTDAEPDFSHVPETCPKDLPAFSRMWENSGDGMASAMSFKHKKLFLMIPEDKASAWADFYKLNQVSPEVLTDVPVSEDNLADRFASQLIF